MKRKTIMSELIDRTCVRPAREAKEAAIRKGNLVEANLQSATENFCRIERDKAKKQK